MRPAIGPCRTATWRLQWSMRCADIRFNWPQPIIIKRSAAKGNECSEEAERCERWDGYGGGTASQLSLMASICCSLSNSSIGGGSDRWLIKTKRHQCSLLAHHTHTQHSSVAATALTQQAYVQHPGRDTAAAVTGLDPMWPDDFTVQSGACLSLSLPHPDPTRPYNPIPG